VGGRFVTYCEIPLAEDFGDLVKETAEAGVRAKLRTGGITEGSIPATSDVVRFLFACAAKRLPFKATAGLHHPLRGLHALTYAPGAPKDVMHGFLNLFLVAAFLVEGMEVSEAIQLMEEANPMALGFDNAFVRWRSHTLSVDRLALARRGFAMNFGSCSFREPIDELTELGFL